MRGSYSPMRRCMASSQHPKLSALLDSNQRGYRSGAYRTVFALRTRIQRHYRTDRVIVVIRVFDVGPAGAKHDTIAQDLTSATGLCFGLKTDEATELEAGVRAWNIVIAGPVQAADFDVLYRLSFR